MLINENYYILDEDDDYVVVEADEVKDAKEKGYKVMKKKSDKDDDDKNKDDKNKDDKEVTDEEVEELEAELAEFKADGEDSELPDAYGNQTPLRKGDKRNPDAKPFTPGSAVDYGSKVSKASMMAGVLKQLKAMSGNELSTMYNKLVSMSKQGIETLPGHGVKEDADKDEETISNIQPITSDDINMEDDLTAMFKGTDLSEEFKATATTIFEAAVVSKVNEIIERVATDNEAELVVAKQEIQEEMEFQLNEYLEYVVTEWLEENKLVVERGIKSEIAENVLDGLKVLFDENYIEVPEEKIDIVEELMAKNEELEDRLNDETANNAELYNVVKEYETEVAFAEVSEGLTCTEEDKLKDLSESVEYNSIEEYKEKLGTLKEQYFNESDDEVILDVVVDDATDDTVPLEDGDTQPITEEVEPAIQGYVDSLTRQMKTY